LDQEELKVFRSLYEKVFELQFETFDFFNPHSELAQSLNQRVSAIEAVLIHKLTESASVKALDNLGVDLLNYLSYSNNSEIAKKAMTILDRDFETFMASKTTPQGNLNAIYEISSAIVANGSAKEQARVEKVLAGSAAQNSDMKDLDVLLIPHFLTNHSRQVRNLGVKIFEKICQEIDLPPKNTREAWIANTDLPRRSMPSSIKRADREIFMNVFYSNMRSVKNLESVQPGICRDLYQKFGVLNFGRFDDKVWLAQKAEENDMRPYVLVISGQADWNAASFEPESRRTYSNLFAALSGKFPLRILEVGDKLQLAKLIRYLKSKYSNNPAAVVFSGHNKKEFILGESRRGRRYFKNFLTETTLTDPRAEKYLDIADQDTVFVFDSCGVDRSNTFASKLISKAGKQVIFPDGDSSVEEFNPEILSDGSISFDKIKYGFDVKTVNLHK